MTKMNNAAQSRTIDPLKYRLLASLTILIVSIVSYLPDLEITGSIICVLTIGFFLWVSGDSHRSLGLGSPTSWWRTIAMSIFTGVVLSVSYKFFIVPSFEFLINVKKPDYSNLNFIRGNLANLILVDAFMWLVGAFGEELVFRGFVLNYAIRLLGSAKNSQLVALLISSCLFGCAHYQWGALSMIVNCLDGFILGLIFLRSANLWLTIFIHGLMNSISLVLIYLNWDKLI